VDPTDEVVTHDVAVGQEGSPVVTASVEDRNGLVVADDDQIDVGDLGVAGFAIG